MQGGVVVVLVLAGVGLAAGLSWLIVGAAVARSRRRPGTGGHGSRRDGSR